MALGPFREWIEGRLARESAQRLEALHDALEALAPESKGCSLQAAEEEVFAADDDGLDRGVG